jgi:hypothetical protein
MPARRLPRPSRTLARTGILLAVALACFSGCQEEAEQRSAPVSIEPDALSALGYLGDASEVATQEPAVVTIYESGLAHDGLNLHKTTFPMRAREWTGEARLVDMVGRVVHRWQSDVDQPRDLPQGEVDCVAFLRGFNHVEPAGDGLLLAHDIAVAPDGKIHTIADRLRRVPRTDGTLVPALDQELVVLSSDGTIESRLSVFDLLMGDPTFAPRIQPYLDALGPLPQVLDRAAHFAAANCTTQAKQIASDDAEREQIEANEAELRTALRARFAALESDAEPAGSDARMLYALAHNSFMDLFHTNSIEVLPRDVEGLGSAGDRLVSFRNLNMAAVVSGDSSRIGWFWGPGVVERPHQPTLLPSDRILIYDNGSGRGRASTRILEVDPRTREIVWSYAPDGFFAPALGGAEALPNGNVLSVDPVGFRAFEITRSGKLVWEYVVPRHAFYRISRHDPAAFPALEGSTR